MNAKSNDFKVGDLLSWIAVEEVTALVISVGQRYDGAVPTTIYTVLTNDCEIRKYPDYVTKYWTRISST